MKGTTVVLRTFGDIPVVAKVWGVSEGIVSVCSPENYNRLSSGMGGLMPIGFKSRDVFVVDAKTRESIASGGCTVLEWNSLTPWPDA